MSSLRATRASRTTASSLLLPLIPDPETSELAAAGYDAQKAKQTSSPETSMGTSYSSEEGSKKSIAPRTVMVPATSGKLKHKPLSSSWHPSAGGAAGSADTSSQRTPTPTRSHDPSGNPRGITRDNFRRTVSATAFASGTSFRTASTTQLYSEPLVCEGEGSVFPVDLPLSRRRAFEVEIIQRFDRLAVNTHVGDFWVMIDANWMSKWIGFVMGKADPPGPVSNHNLLEPIELPQKCRAFLDQEAAYRSREGCLASRPDLKLKEGLQLVKDYRAVHPVVWFIYREIYNTDGAPLLCRRKPNLYAEGMVISQRLKGEKASHTKAVYELRRFVGRIKETSDREKQ